MRSLQPIHLIAIAALIIAVPTAALADKGTVTAEGHGASMLDACANAKAAAPGVAAIAAAASGSSQGVHITSLGSCQCARESEIAGSAGYAWWRCLVDAQWTNETE